MGCGLTPEKSEGRRLAAVTDKLEENAELKIVTMLCLVSESCLTLHQPVDCSPPGSSVHGDSPGKNTGVGCHEPSRGSSQPRDRIQVSHIAGRFFTIWVTREAQECWSGQPIPSSRDLPKPVIQPWSPSLQVDSLPAELPGKPEKSLDSQNLPWQRTHECYLLMGTEKVPAKSPFKSYQKGLCVGGKWS